MCPVTSYVNYTCFTNKRKPYSSYNNNNNYKTSIAPISSKTIELSDAPSTGVGHTHSPGTMQSSSTNGQMARKLRKDKRV